MEMYQNSIDGDAKSEPRVEAMDGRSPPHPAAMMGYMLPRSTPHPIQGKPYTTEKFSFQPSSLSSHMSNVVPSRPLDLPSNFPLPSDFLPPSPPSPPPCLPPLPSENSVEHVFHLPPEPQKPRDIEMLKQIESFAAYVVKNGTQAENAARGKQGNSQRFGFLLPNNTDPEAAICHEFYMWKKQSLLVQSQCRTTDYGSGERGSRQPNEEIQEDGDKAYTDVKYNKVMEDVPSASPIHDPGARSSQWDSTSLHHPKQPVVDDKMSHGDSVIHPNGESVSDVNKKMRFDAETPIWREESDITSKSLQISTDKINSTRGFYSQSLTNSQRRATMDLVCNKISPNVKGNEPPIVDEFGRLAQKGASESESEEEKRPVKRRRSYSSNSRSRSRSRSRSKSRRKIRGSIRRRRSRSRDRSRSRSRSTRSKSRSRSRSRSRSTSRRRRKRNMSRSPRRRARRSRSNSSSPQSRWSYSRTPPRDMRRGDREYYGRGRRGGRDGGPTLCFQFSRGRCSRGSSCKFVHLSREPQGRGAWNQDSFSKRKDGQWEQNPVEKHKQSFWGGENPTEGFNSEGVVIGQGESMGKIQTNSLNPHKEEGNRAYSKADVSSNLASSVMGLNKLSLPETEMEIRGEIGMLQKQLTNADTDGIDVKKNAGVVVKITEEHGLKASAIVSNRLIDVAENTKLSDAEELQDKQNEPDENKTRVFPPQKTLVHIPLNQPSGPYDSTAMVGPSIFGGNFPYPSPINPAFRLPPYNSSSYTPFGGQVSHNASFPSASQWGHQALHSWPSSAQSQWPASSPGPPLYGKSLQGIPLTQSESSDSGDIQKAQQSGELNRYGSLSGASFPGNQNPIPSQQSSSLTLAPNMSLNLPFQQSQFPLLQQGYVPPLPQKSLIPQPFEDSGHTNQPMNPSAGVHLNQSLTPKFPSLPPMLAQNNAPWPFPMPSNHSAPQFPSTSYSYPLTTIPPLTGLIKVPENTDVQTVVDQYDPLSDVLDPCVDGALKASQSTIVPAVSHIEDVSATSENLEVTMHSINQGKVNASDHDVNDVNDVDVGALDNLSPENWSPAETRTQKTQEQSLSKKGSRGLKMLRAAIADHVKEVLKPTWREGYMSKEAFKTIAKKAVEKVLGNLPSHHIPKSQEKVEQFMKSSRPKISKLVQGYVDKYLKL